jgi:2-keto-3-deoxy-L-rhamnonate aldolase RhmA
MPLFDLVKVLTKYDDGGKAMRASKVLAKLRAGKPVAGANINVGSSILVAGLAGKLGMDFVWIDMEHRWFSYQDAALMVMTAREAGADAMVRLHDKNPSSFQRCFEIGATSVMVPHCKSREEAEYSVRCSKSFPLGQRGMENACADADYGLASWPQIMEWHNRESFLVIQIEDREAIEEIDAITAVPNADIFFVGQADLSQSLGKPGQFDAPILKESLKKVAKACEKNEKWWGLITGANPDVIKRSLDMGAKFLVPYLDFPPIIETWRREVDLVHNVLAKEGLA